MTFRAPETLGNTGKAVYTVIHRLGICRNRQQPTYNSDLCLKLHPTAPVDSIFFDNHHVFPSNRDPVRSLVSI